MASNYKVIAPLGSYEDLLRLAPLGTSKRRYYDEKMQYDSSAFFPLTEDCIEEALQKPMTLIWEGKTIAVDDKRLMALSILDSNQQPGAYGYPMGSGMVFGAFMIFSHNMNINFNIGYYPSWSKCQLVCYEDWYVDSTGNTGSTGCKGNNSIE